MFDVTTAALLRAAPDMDGLQSADLPAILTAHYANLAATRLGGVASNDSLSEDIWGLERIADAYELTASLLTGAARRPAAFVAATAQQILARRQILKERSDKPSANINYSAVSPSIAAVLLFLAAEQYADANEATHVLGLKPPEEVYEAEILVENIIDLGRGQLSKILARSTRWRTEKKAENLEDQAFAALLETLICGIEILAADLLRQEVPKISKDRFASPRLAFEKVKKLSALRTKNLPGLDDEIYAYPGPYHLATLLISATDGLAESSIMAIPPPQGADPANWKNWLASKAAVTPFLWPNHREAIHEGFYLTGNSSVVVLPTGAGKTTVSSLKIAGVLASGKKVVFLAPTHALVEQLTDDLARMFPADIMGSSISSDFDLLLVEGTPLKDIEVMTPERCLAMLSFAPDVFSEVGLLVFDECHLLSPESGKFRRALDAMLCVLGFHHVAPQADMLFLSAMVKNPGELASWIASLTQRPCIAIDLPWKPSRQARGVITYDAKEMEAVRRNANSRQRAANIKEKKVAKDLRVVTKRILRARPYAIWGLQHNWLADNAAEITRTPISANALPLAGKWHEKYGVRLTPNANEIAESIASSAIKSGLKTIVFVNTKADAIKVAQAITIAANTSVEATEFEKLQWEALGEELGGLEHAVISGPVIAVPHNSTMLRLERGLAEGMFTRKDGAMAIIATPTLAQGLNLPAQLAILAGDKRTGEVTKREALKAHEILNAAARAGRAGHLANGLVLLIPEPIIEFIDHDSVDADTIEKLQSILPEDDHCVVITDAMEVVLDRIMAGNTTDADVQYAVNRFAVLRELEGGEQESTVLFDPGKSFGGHLAKIHGRDHEYELKVKHLKSVIAASIPETLSSTVALLSTQSGLPAQLLLDLEGALREQLGHLPNTIAAWLHWLLTWAESNSSYRDALFSDVYRDVRTALGKKADDEILEGDLLKLFPGLLCWIQGVPLRGIELALDGAPDDIKQAKRLCPRARALVGGVIPRSLSFAMGLLSKMVKGIEPFELQQDLDPEIIDLLGPAIRKGYDDPDKLYYATDHPELLSRVQIHRLYSETMSA